MGNLRSQIEQKQPSEFKWVKDCPDVPPDCSGFDFSIEKSVSGKAALTYGTIIKQGRAKIKVCINETAYQASTVESAPSTVAGVLPHKSECPVPRKVVREQVVEATLLELYPFTGAKHNDWPANMFTLSPTLLLFYARFLLRPHTPIEKTLGRCVQLSNRRRCAAWVQTFQVPKRRQRGEA